jgi:hypothetical protein
MHVHVVHLFLFGAHFDILSGFYRAIPRFVEHLHVAMSFLLRLLPAGTCTTIRVSAEIS